MRGPKIPPISLHLPRFLELKFEFKFKFKSRNQVYLSGRPQWSYLLAWRANELNQMIDCREEAKNVPTGASKEVNWPLWGRRVAQNEHIKQFSFIKKAKIYLASMRLGPRSRTTTMTTTTTRTTTTINFSLDLTVTELLSVKILTCGPRKAPVGHLRPPVPLALHLN